MLNTLSKKKISDSNRKYVFYRLLFGCPPIKKLILYKYDLPTHTTITFLFQLQN